MARRTRRQINLFDYLQDRPAAPCRAKLPEVPIKVTDDWPAILPVTDHEARIIEAFFADVLDELFGPLP